MEVFIQELAAPRDRAAGADGQTVHDDQGCPRIDKAGLEFHSRIAPNVEPAALADGKIALESDLSVDPQQGPVVAVDEPDIHEADFQQTVGGHVLETVDGDPAAGQEVLASHSEYCVPNERRQKSRPDGAALGPEFDELS
jgi:hypothetical protein